MNGIQQGITTFCGNRFRLISDQLPGKLVGLRGGVGILVASPFSGRHALGSAKVEAEAFDIGKAQVLGDGGDGKGSRTEHDLGAADFEIEDLFERRFLKDLTEASFENPTGNAAVVGNVVHPKTGTADIGADILPGVIGSIKQPRVLGHRKSFGKHNGSHTMTINTSI